MTRLSAARQRQVGWRERDRYGELRNATAGVVANLASTSSNRATPNRDVFAGIENLTGSDFADTLTGNSSANTARRRRGRRQAVRVERQRHADRRLRRRLPRWRRGHATRRFSAGASADYSWVKNADGSWTVTDLRAGSPDGADTLIGIELIQFSDGQISLRHRRSRASACPERTEPHLDLLPLPSYFDAAGWQLPWNWLASLDKGLLFA